jgi:hypothetical protein
MTLSMYQASVPVFLHSLNALTALLEKTEAHIEARKLDPAAFLQARLFPDMFPFMRQVQLTADFAKNTTSRLAGQEPPAFADEETSFPQLRERIARTIEHINAFRPEQIDGSEDREITLNMRGNVVTFRGQPYLLHFALPNFFFHVATAYDLLRHTGVEIGKRDFIGQLR